MLVLASIKCKSPFDQSAYQGSVLLCIQERAYETCANPEFGFCTDLSSPDTGRGICLLYRTNWEACCQRGTNQNFIVMVPPTQHGIWIVQLRTQSYLPPSSFPRYIAGESGTNVPMYFSKTVQEFLQWSNAQPRTCHFRLSGEFPSSFHHIRYTSMWSFSHTVMRYCRVWKLEKVRRWYREYSLWELLW